MRYYICERTVAAYPSHGGLMYWYLLFLNCIHHLESRKPGPSRQLLLILRDIMATSRGIALCYIALAMVGNLLAQRLG